MFKTIYPLIDTTIYSQFPEKNTGADQILEITKLTTGTPSLENDDTVYYADTYNSRILIKFDLTEISSQVQSGKISGNSQYYLVLKATEAINLPIDYNLYAYPVSSSWVVGTGYYNNLPDIKNGTSWQYRSSKSEGTLWLTSSYNPGSTGSFGSIAGGGNWYTSSIASKSFSYTDPDVRMDVTSIIRQWISGSIPNNGFMVKLPDSVEQDSSVFGTIRFFSKDTHTIFIPRLEVYWDNKDWSGTGSFTEIGSDDFVLYTKNLRESYNESEKPKIRFGVRERYPQQTYATSSNYIQSKRLPTGSFYQIQDWVTDDAIIPFHPSGTIVDCDSNGNYIRIDCNSLLPERYYKIVIKTEFDGGDTVRFVDDNFLFKIYRS